jgi:hypothetical protein
MQQTLSPDQERRGLQGLSGCWTLLVLGSTLVLALEIPARLTLGYTSRGILREVDWMITGVLGMDLWLSWFHPHGARARGIGPWRGATSSIRGFWFLLDLLAALPWQSFPLAPVWSLVRLGKVARVTHQLQGWQPPTRRLVVLRAWGLFGLWGLLLVHWLACGWLALGGVPAEADLVTQYVQALYWCISTLTTVGYGDMRARTNAQMLYTIVAVGLALGLWGRLILQIVRRQAARLRATRHQRPYDG